jgi:hypothetical protein
MVRNLGVNQQQGRAFSAFQAISAMVPFIAFCCKENTGPLQMSPDKSVWFLLQISHAWHESLHSHTGIQLKERKTDRDNIFVK